MGKERALLRLKLLIRRGSSREWHVEWVECKKNRYISDSLYPADRRNSWIDCAEDVKNKVDLLEHRFMMREYVSKSYCIADRAETTGLQGLRTPWEIGGKPVCPHQPDEIPTPFG
jgi:hypothetical protein